MAYEYRHFKEISVIGLSRVLNSYMKSSATRDTVSFPSAVGVFMQFISWSSSSESSYCVSFASFFQTLVSFSQSSGCDLLVFFLVLQKCVLIMCGVGSWMIPVFIHAGLIVRVGVPQSSSNLLFLMLTVNVPSNLKDFLDFYNTRFFFLDFWFLLFISFLVIAFLSPNYKDLAHTQNGHNPNILKWKECWKININSSFDYNFFKLFLVQTYSFKINTFLLYQSIILKKPILP